MPIIPDFVQFVRAGLSEWHTVIFTKEPEIGVEREGLDEAEPYRCRT